MRIMQAMLPALALPPVKVLIVDDRTTTAISMKNHGTCGSVFLTIPRVGKTMLTKRGWTTNGGEGNISPSDVKSLRRLLPNERGEPITQQKLSDLLGVSWSTVARWETKGRIDPGNAKTIARVLRVIDALGDMVYPESRLVFIEQHHPLLLNMRPIDLLRSSDDGERVVLEQIEGAATGSFA